MDRDENFGDRQQQALEEQLGWLRKRTPRAPRRMADSLSELMSKRGYAQQQTHAALQTAWQEVAGNEAAGRTRVAGLRRGVLTVIVGDATLMQQLSFQQHELLRKIAGAYPARKIRQLRFRQGAVV